MGCMHSRAILRNAHRIATDAVFPVPAPGGADQESLHREAKQAKQKANPDPAFPKSPRGLRSYPWPVHSPAAAKEAIRGPFDKG